MRIQSSEASFQDRDQPLPRWPTRHQLGELDTEQLSGRLVVFTPSGLLVDALLNEARRVIPSIAPNEVVHRVISHNPDSCWAIARRNRYDSSLPKAKGFVAYLMLNDRGLRGLLEGSLNARDPDPNMIVKQNEKPAGIYVWCVHAPGVLAGGMPLTVEKITTKLYRDVDVYARAATVQGLQLMQTMGFEPNASYACISSANVHVYRRGAPKVDERARVRARLFAGPRRSARRLDDLRTERFGRRLAIFMPRGVEIARLLAYIRKDLGDVASADVVQRVVTHNPDCLWAIARRDRFNASAECGEGLMAFLMLNRAGMLHLLDGSFDASNPDLTLLSGQYERPAGIYLWALHARGIIHGGVPLVMEKFNTPLYRDADIYARVVTSEGLRFVQGTGFKRGATFEGRFAPHLHMMTRTSAHRAPA